MLLGSLVFDADSTSLGMLPMVIYVPFPCTQQHWQRHPACAVVQVAILLGFVRPKQARGLGNAQAVMRSEVSELQSQISMMQELMQSFSQALQQHGIRV